MGETRPVPVPVSGEDLNNPGSLVKLQNGELALVYGDRRSYQIHAIVSSDGFQTWEPPIALTEPALNEDMGYVQTVARPDGKVVVIYYFATSELPEQHIRATIWTPENWVDPNPHDSTLSESLLTSFL